MLKFKEVWFFGAIGIGISSQVLAATSSKSADEFCLDRKQKSYMRNYLDERESRMAFTNHGGLLNGGVCWWHSRFQRNATYLTTYRPGLRRPTRDVAIRLVKAIRHGRDIVTIPGFSNFEEFSSYYSSEIQSTLESWQKLDGFVFQQWVVGLAGSSEVSPKKMKKKMDALYKDVKSGDIIYQKLQIKGIDSHAWLVTDMKKTRDGYDLSVIDSNYPMSTNVYSYSKGDRSFEYPYYGHFVPYTGKMHELRRLKKVVKKFCRRH